MEDEEVEKDELTKRREEEYQMQLFGLHRRTVYAACKIIFPLCDSSFWRCFLYIILFFSFRVHVRSAFVTKSLSERSYAIGDRIFSILYSLSKFTCINNNWLLPPFPDVVTSLYLAGRLVRRWASVLWYHVDFPTWNLKT